jgi:hypothetical protein
MSSTADKIRKLMALANHEGTSPEEASAAAAMAAELALKYNIDLEAALAAGSAEAKVFGIGDIELWVPAQYRQVLIHFQAGIAALYGCKATISHIGHAKYGIKFVGQDHNVALCNSWLKYLWDSCAKSNATYNKTRSYASAAEGYRASVTFRLHFAAEVHGRLSEKLASMRRGEASAGTALVVVAWYDAEKQEVAKWMDDNLKMGKPTTSRAIKIDVRAAVAGNEAGKRTSLADQIGAAAAKPTKRIG